LAVLEKYTKWLFFAPGFVVFLVVIIAPLVFSYVIMFFRWNLFDPFQKNPVFVGLGNFVELSTDLQFWGAWYRTVLFAAVVVPTEFVLGFVLALSLKRDLRGERVIKTLLLLPLAMAPITVGALWRVMYSPMFGVINYFLGFLGIPPQAWAASTQQALISTAIVDIWQWTPFVTVVLLAGLVSIPSEPLEAAIVDGASSAQVFRHLVLPMMRNVILIIVILRVMDAIKVYDILYTLTYGGPGNATTFITYRISLDAFKSWHIGLASAESFVSAMIVAALTLVFIRLISERRVAG